VPAYVRRRRITRPKDRAVALTGVVAVQIAFGLALLSGFKVQLTRPPEAVQSLIEITLPHPPPPAPTLKPQRHKARHSAASAPRGPDQPIGAAPGRMKSQTPLAVTPVVALRPTAPAAGGGRPTGPASGAGAGGGAGGQGFGADGGGMDLELISGEILPSDYPRDLGDAGIGGRVSVTFTVQVNGHATGCRITRSSGTPQLDAQTCRIIEQRFRFRPSTDRYGRPTPDEVDWDHDWIPSGRN